MIERVLWRGEIFLNRVCQIFKIEVPIILGGMGNISSPELVAAVSNAGGLGTLGAGTMHPEKVRQLINEIKEKTGRPFSLNIPIRVSPFSQELAQMVVEEKVPVVTLSAGDPTSFLSFFRSYNVKTIVVTASVKQAKKAEVAGADAVVGEGFEAAGLNSPLEITTFSLIPQLADAVKIPVIAAGGIADGRGLAAAFMLGAEGVQMGTRFIVAKEAPFSRKYKEAIVNAGDDATIVIGRTVGRIRRVLKGPYTEELYRLEKEKMTLEEYEKYTKEDAHWAGAMEGNIEKGFVNSGQAAGIIKEESTVKEIIEQMIQEAKDALHKASESVKQAEEGFSKIIIN